MPPTYAQNYPRIKDLAAEPGRDHVKLLTPLRACAGAPIRMVAFPRAWRRSRLGSPCFISTVPE